LTEPIPILPSSQVNYNLFPFKVRHMGKRVDKLFDLCFIGFDLKAGGEEAIIG
jgi:hypothetical protein